MVDNDGVEVRRHSPEPGQEVVRRGRWTCRLHMWHRWRTHTYPDPDHYARRYQECHDCGTQRDMSFLGSAGIGSPHPEKARP